MSRKPSNLRITLMIVLAIAGIVGVTFANCALYKACDEGSTAACIMLYSN